MEKSASGHQRRGPPFSCSKCSLGWSASGYPVRSSPFSFCFFCASFLMKLLESSWLLLWGTSGLLWPTSPSVLVLRSFDPPVSALAAPFWSALRLFWAFLVLISFWPQYRQPFPGLSGTFQPSYTPPRPLARPPGFMQPGRTSPFVHCPGYKLSRHSHLHTTPDSFPASAQPLGSPRSIANM